MRRFIHLDLFSGIGGFALAVDKVWPNAEHTFCEIDPYCQALLKKRFGGSKIYGDIRSLVANTESRESGIAETGDRGKDTGRGSAERVVFAANARSEEQRGVSDSQRKTISEIGEVYLITGGFPCQPFSQAGKRKGTNDNRFLWPEMLRVIRDFKPTWVVAENVRGLLTIESGLVFEQVCTDLEGEGYDVQAFVIPAVAVNAPHRRDRVWFVANRKSDGTQGGLYQPRRGRTVLGEEDIDAPDPEVQRSERDRDTRNGRSGLQDSGWNQNWLEVATELCGVDDGLPAELDGLESRNGLKLTKARHRVKRLKSLGNAIVPRVAVELMKAIKFSQEGNTVGSPVAELFE